MISFRSSLVVAVLLCGCHDDASSSSTVTPDAGSPDAGGPSVVDDAGTGDAGALDDAGSVDAGDAGNVDTCTGACRTTALEATINGVKRTLDHGIFGTEAVDAGQGLYVEAHQGGDGKCPTDTSPASDRTVTLAYLPRGPVGTAYTESDGLKVSLIDIVGDQLTDKPVSKATAVRATLVAQDSSTPPAWVAVDLDATFAEGTVKGHVFASYCPVLSR